MGAPARARAHVRGENAVHLAVARSARKRDAAGRIRPHLESGGPQIPLQRVHFFFGNPGRRGIFLLYYFIGFRAQISRAHEPHRVGVRRRSVPKYDTVSVYNVSRTAQTV
jgi:hypothetical protein